MLADKTMIIDGKVYGVGEEIPDLGSLVCTSYEGNVRDYEGHYSDKDKLPKYDDLGTGSSALLSDDGSFKFFKYYADTHTWEGNGEVI